MPFRHYFSFPLIESGRNVLQLPMSLNLVSQALICSEAGSGLRFTRENQQTAAFVTPRLS